jgi:hypothetical protein
MQALVTDEMPPAGLIQAPNKAQVRVIVAEPIFSCAQGLAGDPTVM